MATINSRRERTVNLACYDDSSYKILTDLQPHEALAELEAVVKRFRKQVEDMKTSDDLDDKDGDRDDEPGVVATTVPVSANPVLGVTSSMPQATQTEYPSATGGI